jgi:protein TonB
MPGGVKAGVVGGVSGGIPGGTLGGTGAGPPSAAPVGARFLPPQMGAAQKLSGPDPDFPAVLRATAGMKYSVKAKVCVGTSGSVDGVVILKHGPPMLDGSVSAAVKAWRFRPLVANGTPVPFCYFANFDFGSD